MRARAAAVFLAPWPVEDVKALLDAAVSRSPDEPDATVWRTANAAAILAGARAVLGDEPVATADAHR